ncbi:phage/plasmid primase, P4 family [Mesorhizobium sp. AD1-1]|uniref:phage/plasmid primase, P4 family n=1 Tax=Mesorhizobium sp. AD1-1 TaxID=2876621 RepID=UPI001CCD7A84|nr:phage/plasmid primase, P4 family [Mesorhizobium sp. AD1-1]MBZ9718548.1 phage/plasmid primase, P4 family [Mesorhizobium sp. AD1-1]
MATLHESSNQEDLHEAELFLSKLDPEATSFTFQTFDEDKGRDDRTLVKTLSGSFRQHKAELERLNKQGAGVFVTVNETNGKGRKTADIVRVRAVFVDLDGAALEPVLQYQRKPHIVVETSKERWHAYWRVEGLELGDFENAQLALIERFGSDKSVKDLPRVMRLPGFLHNKGEPRLVRLLETLEAAPYPGRDFYRGPRLDDARDLPPVLNSGDDAEALAVLSREIARLNEAAKGNRNIALNKAAYTVSGMVAKGLLSEVLAKERLIEAADELELPRKEAMITIASGFRAGKAAPWSPHDILDPADPMRSAVKLLDTKYTDANNIRSLHRQRETFWLWNGACYEIVEKEIMEAIVWAFTERAKAPGKMGSVPFKPTNDKVQGIIHALRARAQLSSKIEVPAWLADADRHPPPVEFMAVKNGLLHLPTGELWSPTPTYFNTSASDVSFDPDAAEPTKWLAFLDSIYGDDVEARNATQEFIGYCLLSDTSQQKILLMVGPPRSGKGTIGRVIRELVGRDSVAGPTMHSLSGEFGLEPLIPRPVAIISDARIGQKTDKAAVTERLLSISGEDPLSVNRKNTSFWHGKLQTRFIILTNELPALSDGSGAMANRFIIIVLKTSFLGQEDPGLFDKLKAELSGILNWAIAGYERLRSRGHFLQPASGQEALEEIEHLASPVKAFVRAICDVGPTLSVGVDELWEQYAVWVENQSSSGSNKFAGTKVWFGRNLRSAVPGLSDGDVYEGEKRRRVYKGIGLKTGQNVRHRDTTPTDDNPAIPF